MDDYDEESTEIKFNSDDQLPLNKTIEIKSMIIVLKSMIIVDFHENYKYYPEVFLDECLCKLWIM